MNSILRLLCALIGVALILFGFYSLFAIDAVTEMTALTPVGVAGINEARAIYAGSFWAMGAVILHSIAAPATRAPALWAIGAIFVGFILARLLSIAMDGFDPALTPAILFETIGAVILCLGARGASQDVRG